VNPAQRAIQLAERLQLADMSEPSIGSFSKDAWGQASRTKGGEEYPQRLPRAVHSGRKWEATSGFFRKSHVAAFVGTTPVAYSISHPGTTPATMSASWLMRIVLARTPDVKYPVVNRFAWCAENTDHADEMSRI